MKILNKKILFFSAAAAVLSMVSSCESEYLETTPTDSIGEVKVTESVANLNVVINGMHRNMYYRQNASQGQNGNTGIMIYMDVLGEDLIFPATGPNWYISTMRWQDNDNANSGNLFYPYDFYYEQIRMANVIITAGPTATGDAVERDRAMGEAYAFRAYSYWMLTQIYAKRFVPGAANTQLGVPLRLDLDYATPIPRATVDQNYANINDDLIKAYTLLTGKTKANNSHFDTRVIRGLQARVALTQGRYPEAATFANQARTGVSLMTNDAYKSGFNSYTNVEWMWGYKPIGTTSDFFGNFMAYMSRNYNSSQIRQAPKVINNQLFNKFPATDVRTQNFDATGAHTALALPSTYLKVAFTSQKFISVNEGGTKDNSTSLGDVPFMRAAEMYLIEAEALARSGSEGPSKIVFSLLEKNRNPSYATTASTGQAYIDEILLSRRIELWGEGFRFLDLKRLNLPLVRTGTNAVATVINNLYTVPAGDKRFTWLIPQDEIDNSKGVVIQNEL